MCVMHSLERHFVCTARSREALCVLHSLERHCVFTVQSRAVLCGTAQSRGALCVYCTV